MTDRSSIAASLRAGRSVRGAVDAHHAILLRVVLLAGVFFGLGLGRRNFNLTLSAWGLLQGSTVVALLGAAIATTIIAGELDLSVAATAGLCAIVSAKLLGQSVAAAVAGALLIGVILGLTQGIAIVYLRVTSIVFTLGTMIALGGVQLLITSNGKTVVAHNTAIVATVTRRYGIFTPLSLAMVVVVVAYQLLLSFSRYGTQLYAFGAARKEASLAGLNPAATTISVFAISGVLASAAGVATTLSSASAVPGGLDSMLLTAIAVALVGGVSLHGGRGGPVDVLLGTFLVVGVDNELSARGVSSKSQSLATATLLLAAVLIEMWTDRRALRGLVLGRSASPRPMSEAQVPRGSS
jgi:ribose/xylose/arabinose/galactoside ABC-type transport system permease subunit